MIVPHCTRTVQYCLEKRSLKREKEAPKKKHPKNGGSEHCIPNEEEEEEDQETERGEAGLHGGQCTLSISPRFFPKHNFTERGKEQFLSPEM